MRKTIFCATLIMLCKITSAQPINPQLIGQNYYYTVWTNGNSPTIFTSTSNDWNATTEAGCKFVRIGGAQYNNSNNYKPSINNAIYYVKIIDDVRSHGCEPVLTIPFTLSTSISSYTEASYVAALSQSTLNAQNIIRLINQVHKRNLKYIVIANEPGKDYEWTNLSDADIAANIGVYTKALSKAIKEVDPTIKTIGPEYEYYYTPIYNLLFSSAVNDFTLNTCIAGTIPAPSIAAGLAYVDYASFHAYLYNFSYWTGTGTVYATFNPSAVTTPTTSSWDRDRVYTELEKYKKDNNGEPATAAKKLRGAMRDLRQKCNDISINRGIPMGWMLTEMNASENNELANYGQPNNAGGMDARSMLGAQNIARIYALAMEYGCSSAMLWSIREGCDPNFPTYPNDRGFLDCTNGAKRASWYHCEMMAKYFKGTYLKDEELAAKIGSDLTSEPTTAVNWMQYNSGAAGSYTNLLPYLETKAFAAKGAEVVVMVMNHKTTSVTAVMSFSGSVTNPTFAVEKKFAFSANINIQHTFTAALTGTLGDGGFPGESTTMLWFDCNGTLKKRMQYRAANEATTLAVPFSTVYTAAGFTPFSLTANVTPSIMCLGTGNSTITVNTIPPGAFVNWYKLPHPGPLPGNPFASAAGGPGIYQTSIAGGGLCGQYDVVNVIHHQSPLVDAGPDISLCTNTPQSIGMVGVTAVNSQTYAWSPTNTNTAVRTVDGTNTPSTTGYVITASDGNCTLSDGVIVVNGNTPDVMIKDAPDDLGNQPNNETNMPLYNYLWASSDIWVRTSNDGGTTHQQPVGGATNYLNFLVTNRSCTVANSVTLTAYHTKATAASSWSNSWAGAPTCTALNINGCSNSTLSCGGTLGTIVFSVAANSAVTQTLAWSVPAPQSYTCLLNPGYDAGHWCLQAHLNHAQDAISSPSALVSYDWDNMYKKNNVATKNIEILYFLEPSPRPKGWFPTGNTGSTHLTDIYFTSVKNSNGESLAGYARRRMWYNPQLVKSWKEGGKKGEGILPVNDSVIEIIDEDAHIDNVVIRSNEKLGSALELKALYQPDTVLKDYFDFDVLVKNSADNAEIIGGIRHSAYKATWNFSTCATTTLTLSGSITNTQTITADSVLITDDVSIENGGLLTFSNTTILVAENKGIDVSGSGKLIITGCDIAPACTGKKWSGISVGGSTLSISALNINNSFITGANNPLNINTSKDASVCNTSFLGYNNDTCIKLTSLNGFTLNGNCISGYVNGIGTRHSLSRASSISKNIIGRVATAVSFNRDDHSAIDVSCNRFKYSGFGIYSYSTTLHDLGSSVTGADNEFISSSAEVYDKINHVSGNSPTYYYSVLFDPGSGVNITTELAEAEAECYVYTFDTGSLARPYVDNIFENVFAGKTINLLPVPNPSNGKTTVYYNLGEGTSGDLTLLDLQGRIIYQAKVGAHKTNVSIDYAAYQNGIYFLSLVTSRGDRITKKMILSK